MTRRRSGLAAALGPWGPALAAAGAAAVLTWLVPGRASSSRSAILEPAARGPRVGLVFDVGGRGDKSFNDSSYEGLSRAARDLGAATEVLEPVSSEDREAGMRLFASRDFDLVIGVGFIFSSDVDRVARDFPQTDFACVDYGPGPSGPSGMPPNVAGLSFHDEQGSFLVGAVAGLVTQTRRAGFVGGMRMPLIERFEAGYAAGVRATCPDCTVVSGYAGWTPDAFRDPAQGKAIAITQIASGADIIYHASGSTGHGVFEAARDAGKLAIGVDSDQYDEMPGTILTSMIKRADVAVFETIRAVKDGHFAGGMHVFGVADGALSYVHEGPHAAGL
ncbi:MAG: BMP family ABC transporter substrate-binding protein, partial [Polyangiaceae bacterium]|nr:BMP family ABC transporter substrate-binding protein [Polyangiaceae bacterium]